MQVRAIMTRNVVFAAPDTFVLEVASLSCITTSALSPLPMAIRSWK